MKILLVDDSVTERMLIIAYLEELGQEVICGQNGEEAVALQARESPDLILMDVIMPRMDGHQAATEIRRANPDDWVPIIFLSARARPEDIVTGIAAGGDDYLTKPVDQQVLSAKIAAMQRIAAMRHKLLETRRQLENANQRLQHLADVDGLTGLANRRHLDRFLEFELRRCQRYRQPISIVMLDVDHFKAYNDHFGHVAGDSCLKKLGRLLQRQTRRATDLAGRYGGEEFCLILPDTDASGAGVVAETVRQALEELAIPHPKNGDRGMVTLSAGVATRFPRPETTPEQIFGEADKALYRAKQQGRNRVVLSAPV